MKIIPYLPPHKPPISGANAARNLDAVALGFEGADYLRQFDESCEGLNGFEGA